jgi:hypothetical protein
MRIAHVIGLFFLSLACTRNVFAQQLPASGVAADVTIDMTGIKSLPAPGAPGPILVFRDAKVLAATDSEAGAIAAQANVGRGMVVAFAHPTYLSTELYRGDADAREMMKRILAAAATSGTRVVCAEDASSKQLAEVVGGAEWRATDDSWRDAISKPASERPSVLVISTHDLNTAEDRARVMQFVKDGGMLITGGLAWGWLQLNPGKTLQEHPGSLLLREVGIAFADGTVDEDANDRYQLVPFSDDTRDAVSGIMHAYGTGEIDRKRIAKTVERLRLGLRTLPADVAASELGLQQLLKENAEQLSRDYETMRTRGLRAGHEPLGLLDAEQFVGDEFDADVAQVREHPSAAAFPGLMAASASRETREVVVDTTMPGWRCTGLFVPAGEVVTVAMDSDYAKSGLWLQVGSHLDPALRQPLRRLAKVTRRFAIDAAEVQVASAVGGLLYLDVPTELRTKSITLRVSGAVAAPHFVLGETTIKAWQEELRNAPGPWGEIESREIALTVPSELLRTLDDPQALLELWDRIVQFQGSLEPRRLNGLGDRQARYVPDPHVSWGYMYAPADRPLTIPMSAAKNIIDTAMLSRSSDGDAWGLFHEMGHWHQNDMWTFEGTGEVTVNLFTLYTIDKVCGLPTTDAREKTFKPAKLLDTMRKHVAMGAPFAKWKSDPFLALAMYVQLQQAFGWETYVDVFRAYRELPKAQRPKTDDEKRDRWLTMMSRRAGHNLGPFFQAWGVPTSASARQEIADLPDWMPDGWTDPLAVPQPK